MFLILFFIYFFIFADNLFIFFTCTFRCLAVFNSDHFKQILQLKSIPFQRSSIIKGLVITSTCITERQLKKQYLNEILMPLKEK